MSLYCILMFKYIYLFNVFVFYFLLSFAFTDNLPRKSSEIACFSFNLVLSIVSLNFLITGSFANFSNDFTKGSVNAFIFLLKSLR